MYHHEETGLESFLCEGRLLNGSLQEAWKRFKKCGDVKTRNELIRHYLPFVVCCAERIHKRMPTHVDVNDLVTEGVFGLVEAMDKFDPDRGNKFETFSKSRVRGAILDSLRGYDWVPRLARTRSKKISKIVDLFRKKKGRPPSQEELYDRLHLQDLGKQRARNFLQEESIVGTRSLSFKFFLTDSGKTVDQSDLLPDPKAESPIVGAERHFLKELLMKGLSSRERNILIFYYYDELTMREIGYLLGLSESRVSQLHSNILHRLKARLHEAELAGNL